MPRLENYICKTCGVQFAAATAPPSRCPICEDERQYVGLHGQEWTTLAELREGRRNEIRQLEPGLYGIGTAPSFAIGQRALLIQSPNGNVLWDCISLIDDDTVQAIRRLGGISAIAISHPHFYDSMIEWSHAFDAPVYLHAADREWVMRPDPGILYWEGDTHLLSGEAVLIHCGGHFPGSTVLYWPSGADGRGALLTGDTLQVVPDRRRVSFMYSYPNLIPLPAAEVQRIVGAVAPYAFDRVYGGWWDRVIESGGREAVQRSARRYIAHETGLP